MEEGDFYIQAPLTADSMVDVPRRLGDGTEKTHFSNVPEIKWRQTSSGRVTLQVRESGLQSECSNAKRKANRSGQKRRTP